MFLTAPVYKTENRDILFIHIERSDAMKKHSSLKMKLLIIFGLLIGLTVLIEEALAVRMARKAVNENIEDHLIDKAVDTAEIIDGRITAMFQFLEGIARMGVIQDATVPYSEKTAYLAREAQYNPQLKELYFADPSGIRKNPEGSQSSTKLILGFIKLYPENVLLEPPILMKHAEMLFLLRFLCRCMITIKS